MELIQISVVQFVVEIILFLVLVTIGIFAVKKIKGSKNKFLNPSEYLPNEEIQSVKQIYYLIMMALCYIGFMYALLCNDVDLVYLAVFDIALSLYISITIEKNSYWYYLLIFLLIPFGSLTYIMFGFTLISFLYLIHVPVFIYFIKYYYDGFKRFTENNGLGITVVLLFAIIFISFLFTTFFETSNPLNALVMVSNAFTSNGYAVLGNTVPGRLNSLLLVWSGFVISGVGTATLTAALLRKDFNKKFKELEELIKENNKD